ncbi:AAA family ATPase [Paenibacillus kandeliae]|uniref:AAA family ATPase n=1 Tax=Paenibacillus kandeliae TaxID=3231269 RepID=UPI003458C0FB
MTKIILERMTLRNFKGFDDFVLDTDGKDVAGYGTNATGKTTIVDAFYWLLFGKDSNNRTDFEIKKLNALGQVAQHKLDHEVEAVLRVGHIQRTFRKVYAEKWTKKRGSALSDFTGHDTTYFVDGVPVKQKEYKAAVDQLVNEDLFRLVTNPTYFNEHLKMEQRRALLLEICGDIADTEVIGSNEELSALPNLLNGRTIEDHRKVIAAQKRAVNEEIAKIPVRIDEIRRTMPDVSGIDPAKLDADILNIRTRIFEQENKFQQIRSGSEVIHTQTEIKRLEGEALEVINRLKSGSVDLIAAQRKVLSDHQWEYDKLTQQIAQKHSQCQSNQRQIDTGKATMQTLRSRWTQVKAATFEHKHGGDKVCAACGQHLPADQIQAAYDKAQASFNLQRSKNLEQINVDGGAVKQEVDALEAANQRLATDIELLKQQQAEKRVEMTFAHSELEDLEAATTDPKQDSEYTTLQQQIIDLQIKLNQFRANAQQAADQVQEVIIGLRADVQTLEQERARVNQAAAVIKRITELESEEKRLAEEYERLEHELFITEEFIRTKVTMLESRINSKFKHARFKLFETQINGGLKEVCETLYSGVPYSAGLNNAARINVGLDIINTLSAHYGVTAPIFFDNAESVVELIETEAQIIRLIVSESDTTLRIELQEAIGV